jgi:hypothetical protein
VPRRIRPSRSRGPPEAVVVVAVAEAVPGVAVVSRSMLGSRPVSDHKQVLTISRTKEVRSGE